MKSNWTILRALAESPGGRAPLDDIEALATDEDRPEIAAVLDEFDVFQSGMVIRAGEELQITDEGRSALRILEASTEPSSDPSGPSPPVSLGMIDDLIGAEARRKIFGLDLRRNQTDLDRKALEPRNAASAPLSPSASEAEQRPRPDRITPVGLQETSDTDLHNREAIADVPRSIRVRPAPVVTVRDGINSDIQAHDSAPPRHRSAFATRLQQAAGIWRRHLERDAPNPMAARRTGRIGGVPFALITLLALVICAGAVIAYTQIRSLKSEVAVLQRELAPLRERAARAELIEKARQAEQKEAQNKAGSSPPRAEQISLTPEEIRLVRDFIKAAPVPGSTAPPINVGDKVSIATIPLPSSLMEKIPKLLGARFTTRNGAIIILKRDSRQADIVLPPN